MYVYSFDLSCSVVSPFSNSSCQRGHSACGNNRTESRISCVIHPTNRIADRKKKWFRGQISHDFPITSLNQLAQAHSRKDEEEELIKQHSLQEMAAATWSKFETCEHCWKGQWAGLQHTITHMFRLLACSYLFTVMFQERLAIKRMSNFAVVKAGFACGSTSYSTHFGKANACALRSCPKKPEEFLLSFWLVLLLMEGGRMISDWQRKTQAHASCMYIDVYGRAYTYR